MKKEVDIDPAAFGSTAVTVVIAPLLFAFPRPKNREKSPPFPVFTSSAPATYKTASVSSS